MKAVGLSDETIVGEVMESDPPRKLVQTWHPLRRRQRRRSAATRSPMRSTRIRAASARLPSPTTWRVRRWLPAWCPAAAIRLGAAAAGRVLGDLKSLLETGERMSPS